MLLHRLTATKVKQETDPGFYPDGGGLYLQITERPVDPNDPNKGVVVNRSWLFRFSLPDASKPRKRGAGRSASGLFSGGYMVWARCR